MKLYLMRHGEALSPQQDPQRGLTDAGKLKIKRVANHLKEMNVTFKHIFHSKKKRACETAEIMAQVISPELKLELHENITPNDDPNLIIHEINDWKEDTLITSHLPFVPNLMTQLTEQDAYLSAISFETGTIICLEKKGNESWKVLWATSPSEILA